jgi:hypothetical protein
LLLLENYSGKELGAILPSLNLCITYYYVWCSRCNAYKCSHLVRWNKDRHGELLTSMNRWAQLRVKGKCNNLRDKPVWKNSQSICFLLLVCAVKICDCEGIMSGSQNKHWITSNLPDLSFVSNL